MYSKVATRKQSSGAWYLESEVQPNVSDSPHHHREHLYEERQLIDVEHIVLVPGAVKYNTADQCTNSKC